MFEFETCLTPIPQRVLGVRQHLRTLRRLEMWQIFLLFTVFDLDPVCGSPKSKYLVSDHENAVKLFHLLK